MDIYKYAANKKKIIDNALDRYLPKPDARPDIIHKAMRYAVFPGGKRIRPIITLASYEACGGADKSIISVACAIELIHTYTLIHDDLPCMDDDDYRRGRQSCHKKFNEALALLAGDALLTLGFQLIGESGNVEVAAEVAKAIGSEGTIGGQAVDILRAKSEKCEAKSKMDYIISHKTGALFKVSAKIGGIYRGSSRQKIEELSNFGKNIGFVFQLVDDLVDRDGSAKIYGKDYTIKMASVLTKRAKSYLDIFGKNGMRLSELADLILERKL